MRSHETVVVGGGVSGLACASELVAHGRDVLVLEAADRAGGPVETRVTRDLLIERGPQTVRSTPSLETLFGVVGLSPVRAVRLAPAVARGGRLVRVPPSPGDLVRGALAPPLALLTGLLGEPFRRHRPGPRTVHEFVRERFGERVAESVSDLLTLGVYAQPATRIGFESAYPDLADALDRHGSLFAALVASRWRSRGAPRSATGIVSAERGLGQLMDRLAERLGERLLTRRSVEAVERKGGSYRVRTGGGDPEEIDARHVVLAVPPPEAARLLGEGRGARLLAGSRMHPQTLAQFAVEDADAVERWRSLGFLVPSRERLPLVGCLFPSALFPGRTPPDVLLMTVFVGPDLGAREDAEIARVLAPLLGRLLGTLHEPECVDVGRHPVGIPIYDRRHRMRTRIARRHLAEESGVLLAGAGYDGVGLGSAASSGAEAAKSLLSRQPR